MMNPKLIDTCCVMCGGSTFTLIYPDNPSNIVRCDDCNLVFFNPLPSQEYLHTFYSSQDGYLSSIDENLRSFENNPDSWEQTANFILDRVYQFVDPAPGQRLLDVGSAYGFFLMFAQRRGLKVEGIEISAQTSVYARNRGIPVQISTLSEARLDPVSFDIVIMNNVLEHTLNPAEDVRRCYSIMKKDGVIFVAVPNFDSLVAKVDNYFWAMKSWPNHLFYFTPDTLVKMLQQNGFTVKQIFTHRGESAYADDIRVVRDRLCLTEEDDIRQVIECLWKLCKGQELVVIAQK